MGEFRADVEESTRDVRSSGSSGRMSNPSVREVFPGDAFNIRRNGEVNRSLGPSLRALEEHPHESHDDGGTAHAEVRPDDSRMAGVHGDAGPFEAPPEFAREQDLREFRLTVRAVSAVTALALEVLEPDRAALVGARRYVHDARGRGLLEEVEQEVRQQKSGEVVHFERLLEPVRRHVAVCGVEARVVDEYVEPRILPLERLREGPRRGFAREIDEFERDPRVPGLPDDVLACGVTPRCTPARHDDGPAEPGETQGRGLADSGIRTGHQEHAVLNRCRHPSTSSALDVDHGNPAPHEDAHDDHAVSSVGIHIAVHQARRDVEEIPGTDRGHLGPFWSVLEAELTRDEESVEFAGAMVMPTRHRSTVQPRSGNEDGVRLKRLLANDPRGRFALFQVGPVNDIDPRHEAPDGRVILKVLANFQSKRAHKPTREYPRPGWD